MAVYHINTFTGRTGDKIKTYQIFFMRHQFLKKNNGNKVWITERRIAVHFKFGTKII